MSTTQQTGLSLSSKNGLARMPFSEILQYAEQFAKSHAFKDVTNTAVAVVKIVAGQELGFGPYASMTGIHFFDGNAIVGAHLMAAKIRESGIYDYAIVWRDANGAEVPANDPTGYAQHTDDVCEIAFGRLRSEGKWERIGVERLTLEEAMRKGWHLSRSGKDKSPWQKTPKNMLFARCISNGFKFHCPNLVGGVTFYSEEEFDNEPRPASLITANEVEERQPSVNGQSPARAEEPQQPAPAEQPSTPAPIVNSDVIPSAVIPPSPEPIGETPPEKRLTGEQSDRMDVLLLELETKPDAFSRWITRTYGHTSPHLLTVAQADDVLARLEQSSIARLAAALDFTEELPKRLMALYGVSEASGLTSQQRAEVLTKLHKAVVVKQEAQAGGSAAPKST